LFRNSPSDRHCVIGAFIVYKKYLQSASVILLKQRTDRVADNLRFIPRRNDDSHGLARYGLLRRWCTVVPQAPERTSLKD
jgi:hypothetical protein